MMLVFMLRELYTQNCFRDIYGSMDYYHSILETCYLIDFRDICSLILFRDICLKIFFRDISLETFMCTGLELTSDNFLADVCLCWLGINSNKLS